MSHNLRYPSWGRGFLAQRVGEPNPYGYLRCSFQFLCLPLTCRPLGLNAAPNLRVSIVGERSPRPAGWGTQPLHTTSLAHVPIFVPPVFRLTCRPSGVNAAQLVARVWGRGFLAQLGYATQPLRIRVRPNTTLRSSGAGYLVYAACYKHIAPLGLNAAMHRNSRHCIHRGGEVTLPSGLGNPTPTDRVRQYHIALLWSAGIGCVRCYRHIAPLERKHKICASMWGRGFRPAGWGTQPLHVRQYHIALLWSGGLDVSRCYRHIAPLEPFQDIASRGGGEVSSPGLGNPTPTFLSSPFRLRCVVALNIPHVLRIAHCVSL